MEGKRNMEEKGGELGEERGKGTNGG